MLIVQVALQRETFAQRMFVRTEGCVSASGTPTAVTALLATAARTVNKVNSELRRTLPGNGVCLGDELGYRTPPMTQCDSCSLLTAVQTLNTASGLEFYWTQTLTHTHKRCPHTVHVRCIVPRAVL